MRMRDIKVGETYWIDVGLPLAQRGRVVETGVRPRVWDGSGIRPALKAGAVRVVVGRTSTSIVVASSKVLGPVEAS